MDDQEAAAKRSCHALHTFSLISASPKRALISAKSLNEMIVMTEVGLFSLVCVSHKTPREGRSGHWGLANGIRKDRACLPAGSACRPCS